MVDSDYFVEGFRDPRDEGVFYRFGKPFFRNGGIVFYRGCCCDLPCQKRVYIINISGIRPNIGGWGPKPAGPPMRNGYGESHLKYYGEAYDTYVSPGPYYWNLVWVIEYCWNEFDLNPRDNQPPDEKYQADLNKWAQDSYDLWIRGSTGVSDHVYIFDEPYTQAGYDDEVFDAFLNLDGIFGSLPPPPSQYWRRDDVFGPELESSCPECIRS